LQKDVQLCVVGKVFKPNKLKVLALNKTLNEYFRLVEWYLSFNSERVSSMRTVMRRLKNSSNLTPP
jgi:ABC-type xylose transport system substrate-binding protein